MTSGVLSDLGFDEATLDRPTRRSRSQRRSRPRRRASFFSVLGELLITAGVVTLLYVLWQIWIGDMIFGVERAAAAHEISEQWQAQYESGEVQVTEPAAPTETGEIPPVILGQPDDAEVFGTMYIPRFGPEYAFPIAGGITRSGTLDHIGIGHYPGTSMPGDVGNFALAAHRTTWGAPFNRIADLHVGDAIVVETLDGWYTYRFRTLEYVTPTQTDVLAPVPQVATTQPGGRYLTMTSCSPKLAMTERIVGYSLFESFTPRSAGAPASLTESVAT